MPDKPPTSPACDPMRRRLSAGLLLGLCPGWAFARPAQPVGAADLVGHGFLLPGLIEPDASGPFVDLVRGLDQAYAEGDFRIQAYPMARAYDNVIRGLADFVFPVIRLPPEAEARLPYRFTTESTGRVSFVLYSHAHRPLTRADLFETARQGRPWRIEAPPFDMGFPALPYTNLEGAFKRLQARRIDGLVWAQEEADRVLRQLGLSGIRRAHFQDYEDVFVVARNARGDHVDDILSRAIRVLRAEGRLARLYSKVHQPYQAWQPGP